MALAAKLVAIHRQLEVDAIPHAFGGAIAQNYYGEPRGTTDIDVNVFLVPDKVDRVLDSLAALFTIPERERHRARILRDGQTRIPWDETLLDLFFTNFAFHEAAAKRLREVTYEGSLIPILSAEDIVICKVAFNRAKDWIDIRNILSIQGDKLDTEYLFTWLDTFFDPSEPRMLRLRSYVENQAQ